MKINFKLPLIFIVGVLFGCSKNPTEKGVEILPDMVHSIAYEAFGESILTKNGSSMLYAPKESIPRGYKPFHYGNTPEEAIRAGKELVNPVKNSKESIERGKILYTNTCLVCHGETGKGDGPIIPKFPNPPSFTSKALMEYADGRLYHVIVIGFGDMPSHAAQLNELDRWNLINYIRELQKIK